jgi:hypothetical protein
MLFRTIMATMAFFALGSAVPTASGVQLAKRAEGIHLTNCSPGSSGLPPISLVIASLFKPAQSRAYSH